MQLVNDWLSKFVRARMDAIAENSEDLPSMLHGDAPLVTLAIALLLDLDRQVYCRPRV